ncbi:hypothetical protein BHE74_00016008 [Ensete ventricosum]|nr:hypothetical protein BHE74_00016008 [Ensete ventricosum]
MFVWARGIGDVDRARNLFVEMPKKKDVCLLKPGEAGHHHGKDQTRSSNNGGHRADQNQKPKKQKRTRGEDPKASSLSSCPRAAPMATTPPQNVKSRIEPRRDLTTLSTAVRSARLLPPRGRARRAAVSAPFAGPASEALRDVVGPAKVVRAGAEHMGDRSEASCDGMCPPSLSLSLSLSSLFAPPPLLCSATAATAPTDDPSPSALFRLRWRSEL